MIVNVHFQPLDFFMRGVVIFGLEMLGLFNLDRRKYHVLFLKQDKIYFFHSWAR